MFLLFGIQFVLIVVKKEENELTGFAFRKTTTTMRSEDSEQKRK